MRASGKFASDSVLGQTQHARFKHHEPLVDRVHLLDQRFDAIVVEAQSFDQIDGLVLQFLEAPVSWMLASC